MDALNPDIFGESGAERRLLRAAIAVSLALLVLRIEVATGTGFGDAEALYASYALHPQPAYLDHPGLVGFVARVLGAGGVPSPQTAHVFASVIATLVPWLGAVAAQAAGSSFAGALRTVLALAVVPELSIGLFALTPDLLLAVGWLSALSLALLALRSEPGSFRALLATLGAGIVLGIACLAKLSAGLLGIAFVLALLGRSTRSRWRTLAPWCAIGLFAVLVAPVVIWEARRGWPMLTHRLVSTQVGSGLSLRNLGALVGGQLAFLTPPILFGAALVFVDLFRQRKSDSIARLLWFSTLIPGLALTALCLWSRVAEPHWLAPAYLALAVHLARRAIVKRRLALASLVTGMAVAVVAWVWVKTSVPLELLGSRYRARYDLANDLYAWGPGRALLDQTVDSTMLETRTLPVVVGPHYIVCAQAHATLGKRVPVGCNTPSRDDFDDWWPRARWLDAKVVLYVHDSRFEIDPAKELPSRVVRGISRTEVRRGGQVVRTITVTRLEKLSDLAAR